MHINNWVHASDLMKMIKSANSISTLSSEEGLPDNHVITIRERELTVDFPELIQNNIKTDTVTLDLDTEWDGIQPVIIFGPNASGTIAVEYTGEPVHIPGAVMEYVGGLDCSVMGLDDSGEVRLVTKAAPNTFEVVESGEYIGQISEDDVSLLGQILSAIKDVETATSDASSAAEAATAAANSANTAATKATDAANSANTAATKATDAANSANTASERAENAYDALTPIIAEIGVNGNQPRATTNPNPVATASDAYAAKPLEICIKGATRQNLWVNPSGTKTQNGITVTPNSDGSITVSGTSTSSNLIVFANSYALKPGAQYTFSVDNLFPMNGDSSSGGFYIQKHTDGQINATIGYLTSGSSGEIAVTVPSDAEYCRFGIQVLAGSTVSGTYRVMLNEGSTAEPWCPPGINGVDELSVVTAGKNLFTPNSKTQIQGNGGSNQTTRIGTKVSGIPVQQAVAVSLEYRLSSGVGTMAVQQDGQPYKALGIRYLALIGDGQWHKASGNVTVDDGFNKNDRISIRLDNVTGLLEFRNIQFELGSTATAYEPPQVTTTPIDLDGHTLNSLPDGTHDELTIDATGAVTLTQRVGVSVIDGTEPNFEYTAGPPSRIGAPGLAPGIRSTNSDRCDTLPCMNISSGPNAINTYSGGYVDIRCEQQITSLETGKEWLAANHTTLLYPLATPQTIPLTAVTLPTLPSPNITVYHDSDVPSDITVEYVQDINIVLDNLNAKIAALNIAQSISS